MSAMCSIDGCDKPVRARGWCQMHWKRWRTHGDPMVCKSPHIGWRARVDKSGGPDACWTYGGATNSDGYGSAKVGGREVGTHRLAYADVHGPIPPGVAILHHCDNPPCCNPRHLVPGTHGDNMSDMAAKGRGRTTPQRGEANGATTLTPFAVLAIRAGAASGLSQRQLATEHRTTQATVSRIVRRKTWGHL